MKAVENKGYVVLFMSFCYQRPKHNYSYELYNDTLLAYHIISNHSVIHDRIQPVYLVHIAEPDAKS